MWHGGWMHGSGMGFGLFHLLLWVAVVVAAIWLVWRQLGGDARDRARLREVRRLQRMREAGELDSAQFEQALKRALGE